MFKAPDDRETPLARAVRTLRLVGVLNVAVGTLFILTLGIANSYTLYRKWFFGGGVVGLLIPGILFLVILPALRRASINALIVALAAAGFQSLVAIAAFVSNFILRPISPIPVLLTGLWMCAMLDLVFILRKCFVQFRFSAMEGRRGLEPLAIEPGTAPSNPPERPPGNPGDTFR